MEYNTTIPRITSMSDETVITTPLPYIYKMMETIYELRGDKDEALNYLRKYSAIKKKLINKNKTSQKIHMRPGRGYRTKRKGGTIQDTNQYERIIGD